VRASPRPVPWTSSERPRGAFGGIFFRGVLAAPNGFRLGSGWRHDRRRGAQWRRARQVRRRAPDPQSPGSVRAAQRTRGYPHPASPGYSDSEAAALQKEVEFYSEIRSAVKKHSGEDLDIKPYEADMRHLLNTYVQADPAADLGELGEMSLTELIIETGIHDAIARKLNEKGKLSKNAIAEGIINNVRKTIIRDQLTDPRFYEQMSKLHDDLIKQSRADTAAYEEFLRKAEAMVKRLAAKQPDDGVPAALHRKREATVIYNNLPRILSAGRTKAAGVAVPDVEDGEGRARLALDIDRVMRERAPPGWKGDQAREAQVLNALFPLLNRDRDATLALFELIKNQPGY
jgi:type I restriction enzyme, R subunit